MANMTLDEFIVTAFELREEVGGDAPVLMLTARGCVSVQLSDGLGFAPAGCEPQPVILVGPGLPRPGAHTSEVTSAERQAKT